MTTKIGSFCEAFLLISIKAAKQVCALQNLINMFSDSTH